MPARGFDALDHAAREMRERYVSADFQWTGWPAWVRSAAPNDQGVLADAHGLTTFARVSAIRTPTLEAGLYRGEPGGEGTFIVRKRGRIRYFSIVGAAFLIPYDDPADGDVWPPTGIMMLSEAFNAAAREYSPRARLGWYEAAGAGLRCVIDLRGERVSASAPVARRRNGELRRLAMDFVMAFRGRPEPAILTVANASEVRRYTLFER